jgi:hypothetical protein
MPHFREETQGPSIIIANHADDYAPSDLESLMERFSRCGYRFVPLVTKNLQLLCGLEILFLRPDTPGAILKSGDIDNRLKTLFDALRLPSDGAELGGYSSPGDDEDPLFCLLEDDCLISKVSVETDALLEPIGEGVNANDARIVITVTLRPYITNVYNLMFV